MDRINIAIGILILLNGLPICLSSFTEELERPEALQEKITVMEKEFQDFEELASWTDEAQSALDPPPEEDVKTFIERFQGLSKAWEINLQETSQSGENPVMVSFTGTGNYKSLCNLINEMVKSRAVVPQKISLTAQVDDTIRAHMEMSVRFGPWQGPPVKGRLEPAPETVDPPVLGIGDLFGSKPVAVPVAATGPTIQYLGFSSGNKKPSGIVEENNQAFLVEEGERTPGGVVIGKLTPETLEVTMDGKTWQVPIKTSN